MLVALSTMDVCAEEQADTTLRLDGDTTLLPTVDTTLFFIDDNPLYDTPTPLMKPYDEDSLARVLQRQVRREIVPVDQDPYFTRFNPVPAKAVWYAALFPGGGQIYNRKYWKLPIIYGGFLGLLYGFSWNQRYYRTYANAYRDLVLDSPNASYLEFLPPTYPVEQKREYLEKVFKRKKNSYRNYRDYCVVGMIGVYLVAMVDAYVDASLYHFDVSPELDAYNQPSIMVGYTIDF